MRVHFHGHPLVSWSEAGRFKDRPIGRRAVPPGSNAAGFIGLPLGWPAADRARDGGVTFVLITCQGETSVDVLWLRCTAGRGQCSASVVCPWLEYFRDKVARTRLGEPFGSVPFYPAES